jgi:hypothetical protein
MTTPYWKLLGISPTRDEDDIRRAYARRLKDFRPDEDPVGFQRLVGARDAALAWAEAAATSAPPRKRQIDKETREAEAGPRQTARNEDAAPPKTGPEMSLTSSSHQEEETAGDDGSPALEQEKPSDTVPDAVFDIVQPNGAKSPQLELEELVFVRLDEIMQPTKSGRMSRGVDAWDVRTWNDLFNQAAGLSLQSHKRFHDTIGRYLVYFLPEGRSRALEGLPDFSAARGVPAVIEAIEQECRFAEQPGKLAGLCTQDVAMTYFAWLADAQSGRELLNRRLAGKPAYVDQATGIPIFPQDDRLGALGSKELVEFHDVATSRRRWPFRFKWLAMLVPAEKLVAAGWTWPGLALLGLTVLIGAMGLMATTPAELIAVLAGIFLLLAVRLIIAIYSTRLTVHSSIKRVMVADRMLLWHRKDRAGAVANRQLRAAGVLRFIEIVASFVLVVPLVLHLWMGWQIRNDLDRPVEAIVSETVISAFEGVAENDSIPANDLFDFVALIRDAEAQGFAGRLDGKPATVRDLRDFSWLVGLRSNRDRMLGKSPINLHGNDPSPPISATEAMERQRKLHAIADAYRIATPAERIQIEFAFASWRKLLPAAKGPQAAAAIWATIPPRSSDPNQAAFAGEMRKQLLHSFLADTVTSSAETNELIAKLHWLLTVPDGVFPSMKFAAQTADDLKTEESIDRIARDLMPSALPPSHNLLPYAFQTSGYTNSQISRDYFNAGDYFKKVIGREEPRLKPSILPWSDFMLARRSYFETAQVCLDMSDEQSRLRIRQIIIQSLRAVPVEFSPELVDFWQNSTRALLADPHCYRKFFASTATIKDISQWKYSSATDDQYENANRDLSKLVATVPNASAVTMAQAFVDSISDDKQSAIYHSSERDNLLQTARILLGAQAYAMQDYREAILQFDLALGFGSICSDAQARRGQALDAIGEHKRAVVDYHAFFDTKPVCNQDRFDELRRAIGPY